MKCLQDESYCTDSFIKYFGGEYALVIDDVNKLREILRKTAGNDVYLWYSKKHISQAAIEKFAQDSYRQKYLVQVKSKIRNLSAEAAQKYLEELIDKDTLLGIRVLKDS